MGISTQAALEKSSLFGPSVKPAKWPLSSYVTGKAGA